MDWHLPHLEKDASFNIDWRMVDNPKIWQHAIDFDFWFDVGPEESRCPIRETGTNFAFEDVNPNYMQFILSERVFNCMLNAMER